MSRAVVERLSRIVDRRASRRGFLSRSAIGATALAVAPAAYTLRPTTAYAAICNCRGTSCDCGSLCCDGYTDFCCFIYGENLCPPGTLVAGWWKADGSGMCDIDGERRSRYYLDCNRACDPGSTCGGRGVCAAADHDGTCGCADGCNSRARDCTRFRYGQCNQDVECVGAIACRIVTCVPPWQWDPSCTTATLSDHRTRTHDRTCLHVGFTDVAPEAFYTEAVEWMVANGISTGYDEDLFGPNERTLRSHLATFIWRYTGAPATPESDDFDDVPRGSFYGEAVAWMVDQGITTGTAPREFSPNDPVSRAEAVTFLWRLAGEPRVDPTHTFDDVPAGSFFVDAVAWAHSVGVTSGVTPTSFDPARVLTRAEAATFLFRYDSVVGVGGDG